MNIASYALFGNHVRHGTRQFYWDHIPALVRAHHNLYPDWELRIHVDSTYHEDRSQKLRAYEAAGLVKIKHAEENIGCCRSMLWRLLPLWDPDPEIDAVVSRDIDSAPCPKDCKAIRQWIDSNATLHVINDNPAHDVTMMGGMVGFRVKSFKKMTPWPTWLDMIERHSNLAEPSGGYDQLLMSHSIWNLIYPDVCAHRFAGLGPDANIRACYTEVPKGPISGLSEKLCTEADSLMPFLGASSYDIPRACQIFDEYGNPEIRDRIISAEKA
jgi:hypothetical protein